MKIILLTLLLALSSQSIAVDTLELSGDVTAELANGSEKERAAFLQMKRLFGQYGLNRYSMAKHIRFRQFSIPHSHPTLTLNTRYLDDDNGALSTFLHEQMHWFEEDKSSEVASATSQLRSLFTDVPVGRDQGGARSEQSTYLHLIVCMLEYDALRSLVGDIKARETFEKHRHYRWIYQQVLEQPALLRGILEENGLTFSGLP